MLAGALHALAAQAVGGQQAGRMCAMAECDRNRVCTTRIGVVQRSRFIDAAVVGAVVGRQHAATTTDIQRRDRNEVAAQVVAVIGKLPQRWVQLVEPHVDLRDQGPAAGDLPRGVNVEIGATVLAAALWLRGTVDLELEQRHG